MFSSFSLLGFCFVCFLVCNVLFHVWFSLVLIVLIVSYAFVVSCALFFLFINFLFSYACTVCLISFLSYLILLLLSIVLVDFFGLFCFNLCWFFSFVIVVLFFILQYSWMFSQCFSSYKRLTNNVCMCLFYLVFVIKFREFACWSTLFYSYLVSVLHSVQISDPLSKRYLSNLACNINTF